MRTYHIHINGLVQGVGFRPFVCRLAKEADLSGTVSNSTNGVDIFCNSSEEQVALFYNKLISNAPANAIITGHSLTETSFTAFSDFRITKSTVSRKPDLLLSPDIGICHSCRLEVLNEKNIRYNYPFTTCLNCGPRYSITKSLPYDRENTTMDYLHMCDSCLKEYNDIDNGRHFSQTNSCTVCAVPMHFYSNANTCISDNNHEIIDLLIQKLKQGYIIAVKGIGGYLLLCDATREDTINTLRLRKQRPAKPFALLYADIELASADVQLRSYEISALKDKSAPIVLCQLKAVSTNGICRSTIAPELDKIGIMLPYSPLLLLIAERFGKPLIATSANISGSPVIYKDNEALEQLFETADFLLSFDRDIVTAQDDSVIQFTDRGQKIILRRSRGLAPNYFPNTIQNLEEPVLAMGGELKSAFALNDGKNMFISQFLGDQGNVESQDCFRVTLQHMKQLIQPDVKHIIIDKHPAYFVSQLGKQMAADQNNSLTAIQHHKAHFGAVLAENRLIDEKDPVLGFIWDGTGYGDDGHIWGSEIFIFQNGEMERVAHLDYFTQILGDKMSKEPRLSALSLLKNFPNKHFIIQKYFSKQEWQYYHQLLQQPSGLLTSSMGRFLDGIAGLLGLRLYNTYEGEAAMQLEALARSCTYKPYDYYSIPFVNNRLDWNTFMIELLEDWQQKEENSLIAWKVFFSLAKLISQVSNYYYIDKVAFSGGVFQNALLIDLLIERLSYKRKLFFHQQLSPNDECIGFGQIACFSKMAKPVSPVLTSKDKTSLQQFQFPN